MTVATIIPLAGRLSAMHSSWSADERSTDCEPTNDSKQGRTLKSAEVDWRPVAADALREAAATGRSCAESCRRGARRAPRGQSM